MKYRCKKCKHIYEEIVFTDVKKNWVCSKCGAPKSLYEKVNCEDVISKAVTISKNNLSIERDIDKCINCGLCKKVCKIKEGIEFDFNSELCLNCGQCIQICPTSSIKPKNDIFKLEEALSSSKVCIAYTSPAVRVAIGDAFNKEYGSFEQKKLVGLLKMIGFKYVFDTTFGADLTIMEEASELIDRLNNNSNLPMFTSCCPSWIKYVEQFYPSLLSNLSTCKSPIGIEGAVIKNYFANKVKINKEDIYNVAITPCTAKKYEIKKDRNNDTDLVITLIELIDYIKKKNIKYEEIKEAEYDDFFSEGSGAGVIFGNTGGVMEAALRTSYYLKTNKALDNIEFKEIRGMKNVKEATVDFDGKKINVAVIHRMSAAKEILDEVKNGTSKYHFIEVMNCLGGCIGGGGQPKVLLGKEIEIKNKRMEALYNRDNLSKIKCSYQNPQILKIYSEFLSCPLSKTSKELLHTSYEDKSYLIKNN